MVAAAKNPPRELVGIAMVLRARYHVKLNAILLPLPLIVSSDVDQKQHILVVD